MRSATAGLLSLLLLASRSAPAVAESASGDASDSGSDAVSHGHGSSLLPTEDEIEDCRHRSHAAVTAELGEGWERHRCHRVCPRLPLMQQDQQCSEHHHHKPTADWHAGVHWGILYLSLCLLLGAISRHCIPPWIPYTAFLLLFGIGLGALAFALEARDECPMNALYKFDRDGDELVSRAEWSEFICEGCQPDSVCAGRSCGDGSSDPPGCVHSFDELDSVFRISTMYVGFVNDTADDGKLTADEMWSYPCNFMTDLIEVSNMDPHLMLLVFLPILLFESAFAVDMGILRKQISQIWLMALVGVVVASLVTALLVMAFRPAWEFNVCWLLGTITSATDPVAVVALLKELGTDKAIGTLIEGESLLNDGSAVVLYVVIKNWIEHLNSDMLPHHAQTGYADYGTWVDLARIIVQMLIFGIVYGAAWGWALSRMLRRVYNDSIIEISLTIASAYLCFWSAEMLLASSAVIAVVVMGFYLNLVRAASISPEVVHTMHEFYEIIAWMFNTIIFFIAGYKLGSLFVLFGLQQQRGIWVWWLLYPGVLLTRGLAILLLYPLLKRLGLGCGWRTAVVMWWGGLRGSVGLALALMVHHTMYSHRTWGGNLLEDDDHSLPCRDIPTEILYANCIIVLCTVVINGSSVGLLLRFLGMDAVPEDRRFMLNAAARKLAQHTEKQMKKMKSDAHLNSVNWKLVAKNLVQVADLHSEYKLKHPLIAAWQEALNIERMSYAEQFEHGELGPHASARLEAILSVAQAKVNAIANGDYDLTTPSVEYADATQKVVDEFKIPEWALRCEKLPFAFVRKIATRAIVDQLKTAYEMGAAFLRAHETLMSRAAERKEQREIAYAWQRMTMMPSHNPIVKKGLKGWGKKASGEAVIEPPKRWLSFASAGLLFADPKEFIRRAAGGAKRSGSPRKDNSTSSLGEQSRGKESHKGEREASAARAAAAKEAEAVLAAAEKVSSGAEDPFGEEQRRDSLANLAAPGAAEPRCSWTAGAVVPAPAPVDGVGSVTPIRTLTKNNPRDVRSAAVAAEESADDEGNLALQARLAQRVTFAQQPRAKTKKLRRLTELEHNTHTIMDEDGWAERSRILNSGEDHLMQVAMLHNQNIRHVQRAMDELRLKSPLISRIVQNLHATNVALFQQRREINHMKEQGEIAETDANALNDEVNRRLKQLYHRPMADWGVTEKQLAKRRSQKAINQQLRNVGRLKAAVGAVKAKNFMERLQAAGQMHAGSEDLTDSGFGRSLHNELKMSMRNLNASLAAARKSPHVHARRQRKGSILGFIQRKAGNPLASRKNLLGKSGRWGKSTPKGLGRAGAPAQGAPGTAGAMRPRQVDSPPFLGGPSAAAAVRASRGLAPPDSLSA